jgi:phosphatidylinositol-3,4,5-trisphosphate-dependent Rac exchanger protein 1
MRERQTFDPVRFSSKIISTLFCNIEAVLELHRRFLKALRDRIRDVPKFTNEIGTVFTEFREQFKPVYSEYGLNHEEAQKTLNELMQDHHYRAFFQVC